MRRPSDPTSPESWRDRASGGAISDCCGTCSDVVALSASPGENGAKPNGDFGFSGFCDAVDLQFTFKPLEGYRSVFVLLQGAHVGIASPNKEMQIGAL